MQVGCRHYWIIEEPKGPISKGVCRLCGKEAEFRNYLPELDRHDAMVIGKSWKETSGDAVGEVSEV